MTDEPDKRVDRLTDEELARLLDPGIDPEEHARLVARLGDDPDAAKILALACPHVPPDADGFTDGEIERLVATAREHRSDLEMCPHCSGDLYPQGSFCPHCGAQARGNPVSCIKCAKPVREGSTYCPHCGSFFRPMGRKSLIDNPLYLLVIGLVAVAVAVAYRPAFILFIAIGAVSLFGWAGEMWVRWRTRLIVSDQTKPAEKDDKKPDEERKTG